MSTSNPQQRRGPLSQLVASVGGLLATAIGVGRTRIELLTVEIREELHQMAELLVWAAVAILAAAAGILFAGLTLIFAFWDTHRILAGAVVAIAYFAVAIGATAVFRSRRRSRRPFLHATLGEMARDEDQLSGRTR